MSTALPTTARDSQVVMVPVLHTLGAYAASQGFRVSYETHYSGAYIVMKLRANFSNFEFMSVAPYHSVGMDGNVSHTNYNYLGTGTSFGFAENPKYMDPNRSLESVKRSIRRLRKAVYECSYSV